MIVSELMGICTDVDRMNMLHKVSTDIFLAQLHGMTDPTKVAGPSTTDMTTPSPKDGLKLTFQTPPTPMPHLPPRDDGIPKGPPKGSFSSTKLMSRGNSWPMYIGQLPRTPPWHFSTPPGWNPRRPPSPPNPGGSNGGGGSSPGRGPGGGPGRGPGGSPGGDDGRGHGGGPPSGGPPSGGPPGEPPGDPPEGDELGGNDPGDDNEPHNEDPDNNLEDDENRSDFPPPRRTAAPSGYNWDQLNSTAWRANSSRAKTPGKGMLEECNNAFCECLHKAIQDAAHNILRQTPVTAGSVLKNCSGRHATTNLWWGRWFTNLHALDTSPYVLLWPPSNCGRRTWPYKDNHPVWSTIGPHRNMVWTCCKDRDKECPCVPPGLHHDPAQTCRSIYHSHCGHQGLKWLW